VVNIHPENISKAVPHLIMGLLWQIIRVNNRNSFESENKEKKII